MLSWINKYLDKQIKTIGLLPLDKIQEALSVVSECMTKRKTIFAAGNGGSLSNCQHGIQDIMKGVREKTGMVPKCIALGTNPALQSALCNDLCHEDSLRFEFESLAKKGDVIIGISVSGGSENILRVFDSAKLLGVARIGITGHGGKNALGAASDICIGINDSHFGRVEDISMSIFHMFSYYFMENYA